MAELTTSSKLVLTYVGKIGKTLLAGSAISATAAMARGLGQDHVKVGSLDVPVSAVWVVLAFATGAHVFWTFFTVSALEEVVESSDYSDNDEATRLFDEVRTSSNPFLLGMIPRTKPTRPGSRVFKMSLGDSTTWVALLVALLVVAAVLPWSYDDEMQWADVQAIAAYAAVAGALILLNWGAGGIWAVGISRLTTIEGRDRFRVFQGSSLFSSPADGERMALGVFAVLAAIGAVVLIIVRLMS